MPTFPCSITSVFWSFVDFAQKKGQKKRQKKKEPGFCPSFPCDLPFRHPSPVPGSSSASIPNPVTVSLYLHQAFLLHCAPPLASSALFLLSSPPFSETKALRLVCCDQTVIAPLANTRTASTWITSGLAVALHIRRLFLHTPTLSLLQFLLLQQ